ncbi:MAG: hypothetical protein ACI8RD_014706, partial [Bacillariaceae sp.]
VPFFDQTRERLDDAHKELNQLDRRYGSKLYDKTTNVDCE